MSIPRKSLDTSNGRKKTNKLSWCSFFKSLNPCIFARCVTVLFISAMNTQWYHFWDILDQRQLSPQLSTSARRLSFSNFPSLPLKCGPSCLPRAPRLEKPAPFHTAWGPVFSDNCAVSPEGGHLLTLSMRVSLPVEISKLDLLLDYILHLLIFQLRSCWCQDLLLGLGDGFTGSPGPSGDI